MKKKRLETYLNLIQALLDCPEGQELDLLEAQKNYIDSDLVRVMEEVGARLAAEGDLERGEFLHQWARKLNQALDRATEITPPAGAAGRRQAYLNLIESLLSCPRGEESQILARNQDLLDGGLVQVMEQVAQQLGAGGDEEGSLCLREIARQLSQSLTSPHPAQFAFLKRLLQALQEGGREGARALLQENLGQLDESLAQTIRTWTGATFPASEPVLARGIGDLLVTLSDLLQVFPQGREADNLEIALAGYQCALSAFPRQAFPERWGTIQNNLGEVYCRRQGGSREENLESAIHCFQAALQAYEPATSLQAWAAVQSNLARAYRHRLRGERGENLELALAASTAALQALLSREPASPRPAPIQPGEPEDFWS